MKITDLLNSTGIDLNGTAGSKSEAIDKMIALMVKTGNISDEAEYKKCVLAREEQGTTGIGEGVAIPHAKTSVVKKPGLSAMVLKNGVDFDSLDGLPTNLIFLIAAPDTEENIHLDVLGRLSVLLMDENFRNKLISAKTPEEFKAIVDKAEEAKFAEEDKKSVSAKNGYDIVAVTACPTGIAHTYMAAEALENKAEELGFTIKVETNGSGGAKNVLTAEEIAHANCVIIAADKNVEMARFNGKKVIYSKVADGINKAEELINDAMSGGGTIYHSDGKEVVETSSESESIGRQIYKHLMNGVSYMLPFVVGGGILIALAFLFDNFEMNPANFGMNTPVAALFKTIGGAAFAFMMPVLAGFIAKSIGDRPAFAVGLVGGYLATIAPSAMFSALPGAAEYTGFMGYVVSGASPSGFFGALIAGFAGGYLVVGLRKLFDKLPKALEGIKPVLLYPVLGVLIMGLFMIFVVNPPMGAFNIWLADALNTMGSASKLILGLVLGGMMSIDFGGPFNKAAYVFGTASIATGNTDIMAAVMIGGMIPPLGIALATLLFKNKFTKKERQSGITNFVMGLSFITEGAIPFAASDPLKVIPACAIGSAIAGGLSMVFGCRLPAPHGGIFVFPVIENVGMYVVALIIGTVVSAVLLGLFKKKVEE